MILFINMSTIYRCSKETNLWGLVVSLLAHINDGLSWPIPPIYDIVPSVTPSSVHNEVKWDYMDHEVVRLVNKCERNHNEGIIGGLVAWFWTINKQIDQILKKVHPISLKKGNAIITP